MEVIRTVGNRIGLWFTSTSYIPLQTEFDVESYHEIILMTQSMDIVFLTKLFKKTCLLSPLMENFPKKPVYNFPTLNCKKKLMFSLGVELLVTIPIFLILLYSCFVSYLELWGWFECISISFLTLYLGFSNTRKLYYLLFKFKKQKNLTLN